MLSRLLPAHLDNDFRSYQAAICVFALITAMKLEPSLVHVFSADSSAQSVSRIPLDTYSAGAAQNVIGRVARVGLERLLLCALYITGRVLSLPGRGHAGDAPGPSER